MAGMPLGLIIIGAVLHFVSCRTIVIAIFYLSRLRVPRYGAILQFLNFVFLLVTFILCLARKYLLLPFSNRPTKCFTDKDLDAPHPFEVLFIIFAAAFALEEYTASRQHGWVSEYRHHTLSTSVNQASSLHCQREGTVILP